MEEFKKLLNKISADVSAGKISPSEAQAKLENYNKEAKASEPEFVIKPQGAKTTTFVVHLPRDLLKSLVQADKDKKEWLASYSKEDREVSLKNGSKAKKPFIFAEFGENLKKEIDKVIRQRMTELISIERK